MATKNNDETNGCTFQWRIENITRCFLKPNEYIQSPIFTADALEGTKWSLLLYPLGRKSEKFISFYLRREDWSEPNFIEINYQLAVLNEGGSLLKVSTKRKRDFGPQVEKGFREFLPRERVFFTERETFLPDDTSTLQCTLWKKDERNANPKHLHARTVFTENRRSFVWKIDSFSTLKPDLKNRIGDGFIDFDLCLNTVSGVGKQIIININSFDRRVKYFSFQTSIIEKDGKKEICRMNEYSDSDLKKGTLSPILFFPHKLMKDSRRYLTNDVLSLECEYAYSTETHFDEFLGGPTLNPKLIEEVVDNKKKQDVAEEKSKNLSDLIDDLKTMYSNSIFSDTELRTSTRTFPVHKGILSARSPEFRRMFNSHDMKNSGHVDIADLEDDTVHRMLTFIYTGSVEDLQFDSASKLYAAASKYQISGLKARCFSFVKENLCPTKVCEVLLLADQHQDFDLNCFVLGYILEHEREVFASQEWKKFMDTNGELAADTIRKFIQIKISLL